MRLIVGLVLVTVATCGGEGVSSTPAPSPLAAVELRYRVLDQVGRPWYCDPDFYPIARADETQLARQRLPEMRADPATFDAIVRHNGIPPAASLTDDQLVAVYRDWKDLQRVPLDPTGPAGVYGSTFLMRPATPGGKSGERVELRVDAGGRVSVLSRTATGPPVCPICLSSETRIDTPAGPVRVTELRPGDLVWTLDARGKRVAEPLLEAASVAAPLSHEVLRLALADGRTVAASPGHSTADGRTLGALAPGDALDGSTVAAILSLPYRGRTFDVLPGGATGLYWADGVLLASTLDPRRAQSQ